MIFIRVAHCDHCTPTIFVQRLCKMPLTDATIRAAPEGTHWDNNPRGFGIRVGKNTRTFIVILGPGKRHTIGRFPQISLATARKTAKELLAQKYLKPSSAIQTTYSEAVERFLG